MINWLVSEASFNAGSSAKMRTASVFAGFAFCGLPQNVPVERLVLRLPFGFLQKHPLRLQLRTFLDLGLDLINQGLRFRWAYFEGRTH